MSETNETSLEQRIQDAIKNPKNLGEMEGADAIGTVGSADCGDMLRMWVKFTEKDGKKVIDKATFQTFGCETAIAVASVATELVAGKTVEEALSMSGQDLSAPLGSLPPMKIHCAQLVEGALRSALTPEGAASTAQGNQAAALSAENSCSTTAASADTSGPQSPSLFDQLNAGTERKVKIILEK